MPIPLPLWLRATWLGWLLGIPCVVLLALFGEAVGLGGAQFLVGLGMGTGVGLLQGRVIRAVLGRSGPWILASAVGLALPFLTTDIATFCGWELSYSLSWCVALGGLVVGGWQALLLRARVLRSGWWIAGSAFGWTLAATAAGAADAWTTTSALRGLGGAAVYLGTVAAGGLVLGLVTGLTLGRLRPRPNDQPGASR
jgi:hypothetical protein